MSLPSAQLASRVGRRIGRYTLDALLGVGGSAAVYAATHRNGHKCALKVVHPSYSMAPAELERFRQEPYLANKIGHPGIVRIYDDGVDDLGLPYFVMELLDGECLGTRLTRGRKSTPSAVYGYLEETLSVLEKAHELGILHRDIKPSNLFVCKDGTFRVLDFGIARSGKLSELTATGMVLGTPAFMPPEQALGQRDAVGPPTDVFSVGATGLVLLHGGSLRRGNELALAALCPLPKASVVGIAGPKAFLDVLERASAFDSSRRYATASEMLSALRATRYEVDAWGLKPKATVFEEGQATVKLEERPETEIVFPLQSTEVTVVDRRDPEPLTLARRFDSVVPSSGVDPPPSVEQVPVVQEPFVDFELPPRRRLPPWALVLAATALLAIGAALFVTRLSASRPGSSVTPTAGALPMR